MLIRKNNNPSLTRIISFFLTPKGVRKNNNRRAGGPLAELGSKIKKLNS
jgi:hypothetical protein